MQFPESWLRAFVNPPINTQALAHQLTMAGLEVEDLSPFAAPLPGVVVGQVLEVNKHPDADRLRVCIVNVGMDQPLQIVCGAHNVSAGIKVPCAQVGAILPAAKEGAPPFEIKLSQLRGVESQGMLCSARELGLSFEGDGLLILDASAQVGEAIDRHFALDDTIFTVKLTPNRADCLSGLGVAREVSALTGVAVTVPTKVAVKSALQTVHPVVIKVPELCGRFSGRVMYGVNARAATPAWMVSRLERAGQRSISALVDISNYVMLALGQPTHIFDLDKISGDIEVRWAHTGEAVTLLNGNELTLSPDIGVMADANGVLGLAGVMGGLRSAVSLDTQNIYLEAAFWGPDAIRGRARRFNFSTDASHRFERGVDYATTVTHLEYLSALVQEICGGQAGLIDDQTTRVPARLPVSMRLARAQKVIGVVLSQAQVSAIFTRLGFVHQFSDGVFLVTPPSFRFDLEIEADLIEEVARIYGFENIPAHPPIAENTMLATNEAQRSLHVLRHALAARDYQEVVNFSFVEPDWELEMLANTHPIKLLNPIASQYGVMRSSLLPSLVNTIRYNVSRKAERVRVFEVGSVFYRDFTDDASHLLPGIAQPLRIAAAAYGVALPEQWGAAHRLVDYFDVKGDLEALLAPLNAAHWRFNRAEHTMLHPGRSAALLYNDAVVGYVGELHPRWQQKIGLPQGVALFEVDCSVLAQMGLPNVSVPSKFPMVTRDLALVVARDTQVQDVQDVIHNAVRDLSIVREIVLFDLFTPHTGSDQMALSEKSLAFRITLQDMHATLQDDMVDSVLKKIIDAALLNCGARLRN
ncbi:MAG: phenylalanine--tRNA ligase subunit beta [Ottowia sp.]|nr:phenylalanine--tRNA ligase subunit beta [Ottowia sp.]